MCPLVSGALLTRKRSVRDTGKAGGKARGSGEEPASPMIPHLHSPSESKLSHLQAHLPQRATPVPSPAQPQEPLGGTELRAPPVTGGAGSLAPPPAPPAILQHFWAVLAH